MPRGIWLVYTTPVAGREDEFNDWYDRVHLPDLLATPGVVGARRVVLSEVQARTAVSPPRGDQYLALYELDADDLGAVLNTISSRSVDETYGMSSSLDVSDNPPCTMLFEY